MKRILLMHPGAMGASVGAALKAAGHEVHWLSVGRSVESRARAEAEGFFPVSDLKTAAQDLDFAFSVCPPEYSLQVAQQVQSAGFVGTYIDANAISPVAVLELARLWGDQLVDGGIIGPPVRRAGTTRIYLSGNRAKAVAELFEGSLLGAIACDGEVGAASAVKMSYAAYTKGVSALLLAIRALAAKHRIEETLLAEWQISQPDLAAKSERAAKGSSPKAWRFEGEMREIARTFEDAGLPGQFHEGAAEVYHRMAGFKNKEAQGLASVIEALLVTQV